MGRGFLAPLQCAERALADRLQTLGARLEDDSALWEEYMVTLDRYLAVMNRLHPLAGTTAGALAERFGARA